MKTGGKVKRVLAGALCGGLFATGSLVAAVSVLSASALAQTFSQHPGSQNPGSQNPGAGDPNETPPRENRNEDASVDAGSPATSNGAQALRSGSNAGSEWRVFKRTWSAEDEAGYSAFVQGIGRSNCSSLDICLTSDANPYRGPGDEDFIGDCADMAYMLRAYYAWKHGLPFAYQKSMRTADGSSEDLRYSKNGNVVTGRRNVLARSPIDAKGFIERIGGEVSTAMFRTHPETGGGAYFDDFYAVEISREALKPGAIAYDIYGHVGIVYEILEDGRVLVVASHPDFSVTRTVYGPNFLRSKPGLGAGLKAWRPIEIIGGETRADGSIAGGAIVGARNEELPHFSLEQYYGNEPLEGGEWHQGEFRYKGRTLDYYEYVRRKLADPNYAYDPIKELRSGMRAICGQLRDRKLAVDRARGARVHLIDHPDRLPPNIYGTYGQWENYSTPSRDARLKVSFIELRRDIQDLVERVAAGDPTVTYAGADLPGDLWATFEEEKEACQFTYWRSDNTKVRLNFVHAMDRLWDLSFDPYHCPERRWGATGAEFATCTDDEEKTRWYNAQRFLRYQAERTYDIKMDFTLNELKPPSVAPASEGGLGVDAPADADLRAYLQRLNGDLVMAERPPQIITVSEELPSDNLPLAQRRF